MKKYYTLVGMEKDGCEILDALWGSYSRSEVEDEKRYYLDEYKRIKIICTDHKQSAIDSKINALNS